MIAKELKQEVLIRNEKLEFGPFNYKNKNYKNFVKLLVTHPTLDLKFRGVRGILEWFYRFKNGISPNKDIVGIIKKVEGHFGLFTRRYFRTMLADLREYKNLFLFL